MKNLLSQNIDAFINLLLTMKFGVNFEWIKCEEFIKEILENKKEVNFRKNIRKFTKEENEWFINLALIFGNLGFSLKSRLFLSIEIPYMDKNIEILTNWLFNENNENLDCFDFLLKFILQSEDLFSTKIAFLLLNTIIHLNESLAIKIISKFVYKEENTSKNIREFFLYLDSNLTKENSGNINALIEYKIFTIFGILLNAAYKWNLSDLIKSVSFYSKQLFVEFCGELLLKCAQNMQNELSQFLAIQILQVFIVINANEKYFQNSVDFIANIPDKFANSVILISLLHKLLRNSEISNKDRILEKLELRIKQLNELKNENDKNSIFSLFNEELCENLLKNLLKFANSPFIYIYQFENLYHNISPAFIQIISNTGSRKSREFLSKFIHYPSAKDSEQADLYKKLLEIEREEHKKDIEALTCGLMQSETEIQILKNERINYQILSNSLQNQLEELRKIMGKKSANYNEEIELKLELAKTKSELEGLKKKNKMLNEKIEGLLEILGINDNIEQKPIEKHEEKKEIMNKSIYEHKTAFQKFDNKMKLFAEPYKVSSKHVFKDLVEFYKKLWKLSQVANK